MDIPKVGRELKWGDNWSAEKEGYENIDCFCRCFGKISVGTAARRTRSSKSSNGR